MSVMGGAVTGFAKALSRERPDALVKAVDFAPSRKTAEPADLLLAETQRDRGPVEIGYADGLRWTIALTETTEGDAEDAAATLTPDTTFVITGAAGSIVSAIASDLAGGAGGGTFHLLDRIPPPHPNDADLARFSTDREGLKRELFERRKARGERVTPVMIERELAGLERLAAAQSALDAVRRAGGTPVYHQVDLTDAASVEAAIGDVRRSAGRVDVLVHAAGLEVSRLVADKAPEEFDLVFDVKADGWFNLLHAIGDRPLGAAVVFSSIAVIAASASVARSSLPSSRSTSFGVAFLPSARMRTASSRLRPSRSVA
jgi:NAD(P)-dependent dehydrogenase (short-subunit alcohol dehydrogenase family)